MIEFFKVHYDPGPGLDGESCILCGACADALLDDDIELMEHFGEVIEWSSYFPRYDLPEDVYCNHCDCCMEDEEVSDASDSVPCGDACGCEPHGCLECPENPYQHSCACEECRTIGRPNLLNIELMEAFYG